MTILADHTYRARFTPVGGDDGILCIPDGTGTIGNDGMGKIEISGANEARKYALTDSDGPVSYTHLDGYKRQPLRFWSR